MHGRSGQRGRRTIVGVVTLLVVLAGFGAEPQTGLQPGATEPTPILAQAARTVGIRRCLGAIAVVAQRNGIGATRQDVLVDWDHGAPDASAFFSLTGQEFGARSAALSVTTAPEAVGGGCSILAERISAAPISCREVARTELGDYTPHPLLASINVYVNPTHPRETVTLVNSGPGCLVIRRQVQYSWPSSP
jgi:hypothetical protein